jgi:hypothetical protein
LTIERILAWADAHHAAHGTWPVVGPLTAAGEVPWAAGESWKAINHALVFGLRGLPGDSSLAELLSERRGAPVPDIGPTALAEKIWAWEQEQFPIKGPRRRQGTGKRRRCPPLTIAGILAWADAYHAAHGRRPSAIMSGPVEAGSHVTWRMIHRALSEGRSGLPGGTTLARLLAEHRGPDARPGPPPLTLEQVRAWIESHRVATGAWPRWNSGPVPDAAFAVTWGVIDQALHKGTRGLPGGLSLARLRPDHVANRPPLGVERILAWADAHRAMYGSWPRPHSGKVPGQGGESWAMIDYHLRYGGRGMPGGSCLGRFFVEHRGARNVRLLPRLSVEKILAWAEGYYAAHGIWPGARSGPVADAPGETWSAIDTALTEGRRGLPGGTTLIQLLGAHGRCGSRSRLPRLTEEQILAWADAHRAATGHWPRRTSGAIAGTRGEKWSEIHRALSVGNRGLPGGSSLPRLLARHRDVPNRLTRAKLSYDRILSWADAHRAASGRWPTADSGPVTAAPGETWLRIQRALSDGLRGLPGGMPLGRLLAAHRQTRRSPLTVETIRAWAVGHHRATGLWPTTRSGFVAGVPGEHWKSIIDALRLGKRGLPGGTTLAQLLAPIRDREPRRARPNLTIGQVQAWAKAHHAATGQWPGPASGKIPQAPGETWEKIALALRRVGLGLPRGMGLTGLIRRTLDPAAGVPPNLSVDQILAWASAHRAATGRWPGATAGAIPGAPGERWANINAALCRGNRGLPGGSSLSRLLASHHGGISDGARPSPKDRS